MKALITILLAAFVCQLYAQEIERQVIGSTSNESSNGNITISSTVGEPAILTKTNGVIIITEGFQQPIIVTISEVALKFYNGITPNGDGANDTWKIDGISAHLDNEITIFGRSGNEVWNGVNYDNTNVVFVGDDAGGNPLSSGTYFYIMQLNTTGDKYKGWIEVTR